MQIDKNSREVIRVEKTEYMGKEYASVRVWAKTYNNEEFIPTKKGLTVQPEIIPSLVEALQSLDFEAK